MCLRADATTSAIHVRLILPGECHGDYPPRLCHTPFTRIWPHEELCRFSALVTIRGSGARVVGEKSRFHQQSRSERNRLFSTSYQKRPPMRRRRYEPSSFVLPDRFEHF